MELESGKEESRKSMEIFPAFLLFLFKVLRGQENYFFTKPSGRITRP
jgi:hypothetical protein